MISRRQLKLALPKGRMMRGVVSLLADANIDVSIEERGYRPRLSIPDVETKVLKPQSIVEMLAASSRDLGFAGADWVAELHAEVVPVLDTGLDPVKLIAAVPASLVAHTPEGALPTRPLLFASEYVRLTTRWCGLRGADDRVIRSFGATEVFPPEDADGIVDVTSTGATLAANGLVVVDTLLSSSTQLFASPRAWDDPSLRARIEDVAMLLRSVLEPRSRVMLELNVSAERLDEICRVLPCMREPTVAALRGGAGFAVKAAVQKSALAALLPILKQAGGADIVISPLAQVVP